MTEGHTQRTAHAKDEIFSAIRKSLAASAPFDGEHQRHHSAKSERKAVFTDGNVAPESLVAGFKNSLELVGGHFHSVARIADAREIVGGIAANLKAERIAVSDSNLVRETTSGLADLSFDSDVTASELFGFDLGITSAQWAIAETGTLVLESDREKNRLVSLVPPVHVCLLSVRNIRQTLGEILAITGPNLSRTMTFITGASRTSDIELTLAVGVHGPGELHVIVVNEE